jgi:hypothetical protein
MRFSGLVLNGAIGLEDDLHGEFAQAHFHPTIFAFSECFRIRSTHIPCCGHPAVPAAEFPFPSNP